jgi:hypothetical protein
MLVGIDRTTRVVRTGDTVSAQMSGGGMFGYPLPERALPVVAAQPGDRSVEAGQSTTLTVTATSATLLTYQWLKDGVAIPGATAPTLTLSNLQPGDAGSYVVAIANAAGSVGSIPAKVVIAASSTPIIGVQPASQLVRAGASLSFSVTASAILPLSYQWQKDGVPIGGATSAALALDNVQASDGATYRVVVSTNAGAVASSPAGLCVVLSSSQTVVGGGYVPGGTATVSNQFSYAGPAGGLRWQVLLPDDWSVAASAAGSDAIPPPGGTSDLAEWHWTAVPPGPVAFTYTLAAPAGVSSDQSVAALVQVQFDGGASSQLLIQPDPLVLRAAHSADTSSDRRIGLLELTRVIELYNTRNGSTRTGCYRVDATGEDGFAPEPSRGGGAGVTLAQYHAGDSNRDGKFSLLELTRVIELYNYRSGTTRTGQYRVQAGTEDGFAPGP